MTRIFVDTGGWIAVATRRDQYHAAASDFAAELARRKRPLLTTNYVLVEAYTHIRYHDGHHKVVAFDDAIHELIEANRLSISWIDPSVHSEALAILRRYSDQAFSLVDCSSFVIARRKRVREVFGFDGNFRTFGFILKPLG